MTLCPLSFFKRGDLWKLLTDKDIKGDVNFLWPFTPTCQCPSQRNCNQHGRRPCPSQEQKQAPDRGHAAPNTGHCGIMKGRRGEAGRRVGPAGGRGGTWRAGCMPSHDRRSAKRARLTRMHQFSLIKHLNAAGDEGGGALLEVGERWHWTWRYN